MTAQTGKDPGHGDGGFQVHEHALQHWGNPRGGGRLCEGV